MEIKHLIYFGFIIVFTYFGFKIFRKRTCDTCGLKMTREVIENHIVYKCPNCPEIKESGVYLGADDS